MPTDPRRDPDRHLDFGPLDEGVALRARVRAVGGNNRLVIGATIGVLILATPLVALVGVTVVGIATGTAVDVWLILGLVGGFLLGAYVLADVLHQARGAGGLAGFAETNGLRTLSATIRTDYAGTLFADGSHLVDQAVRTAEKRYVEVGDRFPTTPPPTTADENARQLYLRARLPVGVPPVVDLRALVTEELHERIERFAGAYWVEVSRGELTLFGTRELDAGGAGRVEEAIALSDALVDRVVVVTGGATRGSVPGEPTDPAPTVSGVPVPTGLFAESADDDHPDRRPPRALTVVAATLALVVAVPLAFAVVGPSLSGPLGVVVVVLMIGVTSGAVTWLVRSSTTSRRRP